MQPHQVVSSLVLVLNLGIVGTDAFRPVVEFVVFPGFGIGQSEQVMTVAAEQRTEPARFKDGLCQYNPWVLDAVSDDFMIEIGIGEFRYKGLL